MDPVLTGTAVRGVLGAGQLALSLLNKPGARPTMTTPASILEMKKRARSQANASTDSIYENQKGVIDTQASNAVTDIKGTARNASDVIGGMASVQGNANRAKRDANLDYSQRKLAYENNYNNSLAVNGQYEQQNQEYNKIAPYEEAVTANNQLKQAGLGNLTDSADMYSMYSASKQKKPKPKLYETSEINGRSYNANFNPFSGAGGVTIPDYFG